MNISNKMLLELALSLLLLGGCSSQNNVSEQITSTVIPSVVIPSITFSPTSTEIPIPTATYTYSEVINAYVNGEIEIDFELLSKEEYAQYSIDISEELNSRIEAPMYFSKSDGQTVYFDENTCKDEQISTTIFLKKRADFAPNLYIPAKQDEDGVWMYLDGKTNQYIRIENSVDVDFSMVIDSSNIDSSGTMINWYQKENGEPTQIEAFIKDGKMILVPMVLIDNDEINIPMESTYNGNWVDQRGFSILVKRAYGFEKIYIISPGETFSIRDEGASKSVKISLAMGTESVSNLREELMDENQVYFAIIPTNPEYEFTSDKISWEKLQGTINPSDANQIVTNYDGRQTQPKSILSSVWVLIKH